jgi:hypothetical protein
MLPLDGSKILYGLLPSKHEGKIYFIERWGFSAISSSGFKPENHGFFLSSLMGNNLF